MIALQNRLLAATELSGDQPGNSISAEAMAADAVPAPGSDRAAE
jgi:hypothetical protein